MTVDELRESLVFAPKNGFARITPEQRAEMEAYAKRYMAFMDAAKTEREATAWTVAEAEKNERPLIVSECCWGAFDDKLRAEYIRVSLSTFKKYGLGFVAHALMYCGCTDLHDPCDGRFSPEIGNLCFINKDGAVRHYHEIFNEF